MKQARQITSDCYSPTPGYLRVAHARDLASPDSAPVCPLAG